MQPDKQTRQSDTHRHQAVHRRTALEAKLLAYRCGWLAPDEVRVRRLQRALERVLAEIGRDDPMARQLLMRAAPKP
ncbi:MAG: hypothetical protein P8Y69_07345 [Gammaproteobacteria bacterium]